jgi:hypothetical protein
LQVKFRQSWSKNHLPQTQLKNWLDWVYLAGYLLTRSWCPC